jgi:hypothetical protein
MLERALRQFNEEAEALEKGAVDAEARRTVES